PIETDYYNNRGNLRIQLNNYQGAEADFTQAIEFSPDDVNGYTNRGLLRTKVKNYRGAIADLQRAAQLYRQQNEIDEYRRVQKLLRQLQPLAK
ncbi:tetratricopeptide repeat protein, partial [Nostoc sp. CCCryo 231-06]|nr:tetratricopeptide repeat protein [Nostoc sp. CCCryo 231-06]